MNRLSHRVADHNPNKTEAEMPAIAMPRQKSLSKCFFTVCTITGSETFRWARMQERIQGSCHGRLTPRSFAKVSKSRCQSASPSLVKKQPGIPPSLSR